MDKFFTGLSGFSIVLLTAALLIVLVPMLLKGGSAVFFKGTVEFRKMQADIFNRGDDAALKNEKERTRRAREFIYDSIETFKNGIDPAALSEKVRQINRQFGEQLKDKGIEGEDYQSLRSIARELRDKLIEAFESNDRNLINENIKFVFSYKQDNRLANSGMKEMFAIAEKFSRAIENVDFQKRDRYAQSLGEIEEIVTQLLGPKPGEPVPVLAMARYGATRWEQAEKLKEQLLYPVRWVGGKPGEPLVAEKYSRQEEFKGTAIEPLFGYVDKELSNMLEPRRTFYWQFFIDDSINSHYFGGVGPEILGTLLLTIVAMIFVIPLGVISAAYLVECSTENLAVKIIRMCINTLAGVPSIVFGLFGLAFFVLYLLPLFGAPSKGNILAASLTLAVLTLPLMIRASEEALRAVPHTYKEASLALGAGHFRTFIKVTLPAAMPGILTGIILSLGRVAGETAPILFTGTAAVASIPKSLFDATRTLSYGSYDMAVGDRIAAMVPHQQYGMVVTLILLVLILNTAAILLRWKISKKLRGH